VSAKELSVACDYRSNSPLAYEVIADGQIVVSYENTAQALNFEYYLKLIAYAVCIVILIYQAFRWRIERQRA
jgi:hypothetical protein